MRKSYSLAVLAGVLALAACGKKPEKPTVEDNAMIEEPGNVTEVTPPAPPPPVEATNAAAVSNRIAPPEISEEQQMQDDAEATGMTSRVLDEEPAPATGGTAAQ